MPTTPRRSSQGTRRVEKPHLPFRGEQTAVGKRTGAKYAADLPRDSDDFEDFEQFREVEDPHKKKKQKRIATPKPATPESDDENGEMSMDIDESPLRYIQTSKPASSARRVGSSARPVARNSDVDYDKVPSPRPQSSRGARTPRASRLSAVGHFFDDNDDDPLNGMDDFGRDDSPPHTSFQQMDQDDDDEPGIPPDEEPPDDETLVLSTRKKGKGKAKPPPPEPEPEPEEEDDIAQGLNDLGPGSDDEQEEDAPPPPPPSSKKKKAAKQREESQQPDNVIVRKLKKKENRDVPDGVRRSSRVPIAPLQWWRNEKVIYGRTDNDEHILVPKIKEILRIQAEPAQPLSKKPVSRKRKRDATPAPDVSAEDPEKGWDEKTVGVVKILSYPDGDAIEKEIAFPSSRMKFQEAANNDWKFQRLFGDGSFMAAGELIIPPKKRKETKRTKDNTFVFYVIQGAINLKVHQASMVLCSGAAFMVPRGNSYFIENIGKRDAKLFFSQARTEPSEAQPRRSSVKRSSVAAESSDGPTRRAQSSKI